MVYGFVTLDANTAEQLKIEENKHFEVSYRLNTRAKNADQFEW